MRRSRIARIVLLFVVIGPIAIFAFGQLVMFLWNNALVPVLHVSEVTFWQGLGLLLLAKILFSSFSGKSGSNHYYRKERMMWDQMTPEQKEKFKFEWRNRSRRWGHKSWPSSEEAAGQP
jgi:Ca2+/H+ antiporter, TMEM165/GDT1 family